MSMGQTGMGGMGEMQMPIPPNSLPMRGAPGPFGYIDMGGMFTLIKIRDRLLMGRRGLTPRPAAGELASEAGNGGPARRSTPDPVSSGAVTVS